MGQNTTCKLSASWELCCLWKDGFRTWDKPSNLKESHPVQAAKFPIAQGFDHKPLVYANAQEML